MAAGRSTPLRKRRTREHVIADLSVNHLERFVLRCGWTIQRTNHDYGVDLLMETYSDMGEPQVGRILFQLKATDKPKLRKQSQTISVRIEWRDATAWSDELMPVILVLFDAGSECAYWLHVQPYFAERRGARQGDAATTTVSIPCTQVVDEMAIARFAALRDEVLSRIRRVISDESH